MKNLIWAEESSKTVFTCPIFRVTERLCRHENGKQRKYSVLDTSDWAIVIPLLETARGKEFVMVRNGGTALRNLAWNSPAAFLKRERLPARQLPGSCGKKQGFRLV